MATEENLPAKPNEYYGDLFEMAADVDEGQIFIEPRCKLCNSSLRQEAEDYCEKARWNYSQTAKWLEAKGEKISDRAVRNHIEDHFRPMVKRMQVKHYANDLAAYMKVKQDHKKTLEIMNRVLLKELMEIASQSNALNHYDRLKTIDAMTKLVGQIKACIEGERAVDEAFSPVYIAAEKLNEIVMTETQDASPEVQQRLNKVVHTFLERLEGVSIKKGG